MNMQGAVSTLAGVGAQPKLEGAKAPDMKGLGNVDKSSAGQFGVLMRMMMANADKAGQLLTQGSGETDATNAAGAELAALLAAMDSGNMSESLKAFLGELSEKNPELANMISDLQSTLSSGIKPVTQIIPEAVQSLALNVENSPKLDVNGGEAVKDIVNQFKTELFNKEFNVNSGFNGEALAASRPPDKVQSFMQNFETLSLEEKQEALMKAASFILGKTEGKVQNFSPEQRQLMASGMAAKNGISHSLKMRKNISNQAMSKSRADLGTGENKAAVNHGVISNRLNAKEVVLKGMASAHNVLKDTTAMVAGKGNISFGQNANFVNEGLPFRANQPLHLQSVAQVNTGSSASSFNLPVHDPAQVQNLAREMSVNISKGNTDMRIALRPDHLGSMTVKVSLDADNNVSMTMRVETAQVKQMMEGTLGQLRESLSQQGIKLGDLDVGVQDSGVGQQNRSGESNWQGSRKNMSFFEEAESVVEEQEHVHGVETNSVVFGPGVRSVNYLA